MTKYNFSEALQRKGTASAKWDLAKVKGYPEDILCMWVADMEFPVMPEITEALRKRVVEHPIYGYSTNVPGCVEAVCNWQKRRYGWEAKPEWVLNAPGIVSAFKMAVQCYTKPGESVLIQKPVYYPFTHAVVDNDRTLVNNPLINRNGRYEIDFEDFEQKIVDNNVKLFLLCSPHNPVGRVWTAEELIKMGDICIKHKVIILSDEVHQDFVYSPNKFIPFLTLKKEYEEHTIVCTAPSKTFNLAGLKFSNIFIPNPKLREPFFKHLDKCGVASGNVFGSVGAKAAYEYGDSYVDELVAAIQDNIQFFKQYLEQELPMLKLIEPEGLYLVWVDVSALGLENHELTDFMINEARVWLDEGYIFGEEGVGYERFNLAHSKEQIKEAIDRIKAAAVKRGLI